MTMPFDALDAASDADLLRLYAEGDPTAARVLTLRLTPMAMRLAARVLGDMAEAEDVAQEAMLRLWKAAPGWRADEAKVSTWLYTVTRNLCMDRMRRKKSRGGAAIDLDAIAEPVDPGPAAEVRLTQAARSTALQDALASLPDRQREAVVLRHLEGLTNPEIAQIMDISTEAVESLTARGKRNLATALAARRTDLGYDDEH
jgi:RNA polymerase sigma factor (sigma-70 family)